MVEYRCACLHRHELDFPARAPKVRGPGGVLVVTISG